MKDVTELDLLAEADAAADSCHERECVCAGWHLMGAGRAREAGDGVVVVGEAEETWSVSPTSQRMV